MPSHIGQNHEPLRRLMKKKYPQPRIHPQQNPAQGQQDGTEAAIFDRVVYSDLVAIKSRHNQQSSFRYDFSPLDADL